MTFPEALRTLAQLRPEMFKLITSKMDGEIYEYFRWLDDGEELEIALHVDWEATQDGLDSILLLLDRRVLLRESVTVTEGKRGVRLVATIFDLDWKRIVMVETDETEKNPAMRKALVAVVEELKEKLQTPDAR